MLFLPFWTGGGGGDRPHSEPARRPSLLPPFFTAVPVAVVVAECGAPLPFLPVEAEEEVEVENANTLLTPLPAAGCLWPPPGGGWRGGGGGGLPLGAAVRRGGGGGGHTAAG